MHQLYYISQGKTIGNHLDNIQEAVKSGVRLVQLRLKDVSIKEYIEAAKKVKELCEKEGAIFIVNDLLEVALESKADGVHVGQEDMAVAEVKVKVGERLIVGGTANTFEQVQKMVDSGADYLGVGPFRFTETKKKLSPILGVEGYRNLIERCKANKLNKRIYAIGGIVEADFDSIIKTGIYGIAVSGLITKSEEKAQLVERLNTKFTQ